MRTEITKRDDTPNYANDFFRIILGLESDNSTSFLDEIPDLRTTYYTNIITLAITEAQAIKEEGFKRQSITHNSPVIPVKIGTTYFDKDNSAIINLIVKGKLPDNNKGGFGKSCVVVSLQPQGIATVNKIVGIAEQIINTDTIKIKVPTKHFNDKKEIFFWNLTCVGSVLTQQRIFVTCHKLLGTPNPFPYEDQIITGELTPTYKQDDDDIPLDTSLNRPQQDAVTKFIKLESGMQLLHGPPGTGKTATIAEIVKAILQDPTQRILICASSNNAVQELA